MEKLEIDEFHARLKLQGVSSLGHVCLVCPVCGTPQSRASLEAAGATAEEAERIFGFSCEGRLTKVGPWPGSTDRSAKAVARRKVRGCDWTLGGLFKLHVLEVVTKDGVTHPLFAIARPEVAQELERSISASLAVSP